MPWRAAHDVGGRARKTLTIQAGRHHFGARSPGEQGVLQVLEPREALAGEADDAEEGGEQVAVRICPCEVRREGEIRQIEAGDLLLGGSAHLVCERDVPAVLAQLGPERGCRKPKYRTKAAETGLRAAYEVVVRHDVHALRRGSDQVAVAVVDRPAQGRQRDALVDLLSTVGGVVNGVDALDLDQSGRQARQCHRRDDDHDENAPADPGRPRRAGSPCDRPRAGGRYRTRA